MTDYQVLTKDMISIVYIISGVLETLIGHFLWYGSGMESVIPDK